MKKALLLLLFLVSATTLRAQSIDSLNITVSGFLDTYFMYDFNNLAGNVASHPFTSPLRHNEFNVSLAQIEIKGSSRDIHGTLSLHTGTSVKANYAGEINNRELSQLIHEAWAGYQVADGFWIDAGIYPAPYGFEGWISRDNKVYTPSIVANFCPYYQTGIRASWQTSDVCNVALNILNGWQNISENNTDKAIGITLGYTPSGTISIIYNNFIGNEQPSGTPAALRFFHDLCTRITASDNIQFDLVTDYGTQKKNDIDANWYGMSLIGRIQATSKLAIAIRGEYYKDEHQVILTTGSANGFDGFGASVNADVQIAKPLVWRTELRMLKCKDQIFNSADGAKNSTAFVVSSFALSL